MSTETRYSLTDVYERFPDDGKRRELIDGELFVSPLALRGHQLIVAWLTHRFMAWVEVNGGQLYPGVNVDLADDTHLEPDVAFVAPDRAPTGDGLSLSEPPDLVIEVSSPSTKRYDKGRKRERYATAGLEEFWFVDRDRAEILVWDLAAGQAEPTTYRRGDRIATDVAPGLAIDVADVLR